MRKGQSADSVVRYTKFLGLDKSNDSVNFALGEGVIKLKEAKNVNITRDMKPERRDGRTVWASGGKFSSLWGNKRYCFGVEDGSLVQFAVGGSRVTLLSGVGDSPMSFVDGKNGFIYFTNGVVIGKIGNSGAVSLGSSSDQFKTTLPIGSFVSFLSPRVLVARGNVVYLSDAVNRDVYHKEQGFLQFETAVRMVAPVGGSLYVSDTTSTWFLQRMQSNLEVPVPKFKWKRVLGYPALNGNVCTTLYNVVVGKSFYSEAAAWLTRRGVCIGGEDGNVVNLTEDKSDIPGIPVGGAMCFRQVGDLNLLISIFKGVGEFGGLSGSLAIDSPAPNLIN